jgi:hypothetical protein
VASLTPCTFWGGGGGGWVCAVARLNATCHCRKPSRVSPVLKPVLNHGILKFCLRYLCTYVLSCVGNITKPNSVQVFNKFPPLGAHKHCSLYFVQFKTSFYYISNILLILNNVGNVSDVDRLCGLVVRVLGYRSGGPGSIRGTTRKKSSGSRTGSTQPREYN